MTVYKQRKFEDPTVCANIFASIFIHFARTVTANDPQLGESALTTVRRQVLVQIAQENLSDADLRAIMSAFDAAFDGTFGAQGAKH